MFAIILLGFALRVYRIDAVPLRGDEAFSLLAWTGPLNLVLRDIAPIDPQPPLAFAGLSLWVKLAGTSELAGRFYSALWSVLTIAPLYQIGKKVSGPRVATLAALLWAVNPFQVWHAQDIRAYTLWPAFSALAVWCLLISVESRSLWRRTAYVIATALAAYSFYTEGFFIVFHNLYALWRLRGQKRRLWGWPASQVMLAALLAPWYLQAPRLASSGYSGTASRLTTLSQVFNAIPETLGTLLFGQTLPPALGWQTAAYALALTISAGAILYLITIRSKPTDPLFLIGYATIPLILLLSLSAIGHFYRPRYLNAAAPAYTLLAATLITGLLSPAHRPARQTTGLALLAGMLGLSLIGLSNYYFNPAQAKAPDWPALAEALHANARPDDIILRNVPDPAFDYYFEGPTGQITLPREPNTPQDETEDRLEALLTEFPRVWFIPIEQQFWDPENIVAAYLQTHGQLVVDASPGDLRLQRWSSWDVSPGEIPHPTSGRLGDVAEVTGFDTAPFTETDRLTLHPGQTMTLVIYWRPLADSQQPLAAFTHLLGPARPDGSIFWAGHDHPPQDGRIATTAWQSEGLLRDSFVITVPDDAPQDDYRLVVGLYDPETGVRLPAYDGDTRLPDDSIPLVNLTVIP